MTCVSHTQSTQKWECPMFTQGDRSISLSLAVLQKVAETSSPGQAWRPVTLLSRGTFLLLTSSTAEGSHWRAVSSLQGMSPGHRVLNSILLNGAAAFKLSSWKRKLCSVRSSQKVRSTTTEGPLSWKRLSPLDKPWRPCLSKSKTPGREARQTTGQGPGYSAKSFGSNAKWMLNQNVNYKIHKQYSLSWEKYYANQGSTPKGYWTLFCTKYA